MDVDYRLKGFVVGLETGARLGFYEILAPIGAGGMGEVYRARDTRLGHDVAVKTLPDGLSADTEKLARFRREAQLLASLNHPNVATVHGLEEHEGRPFLVMELLEGETLSNRIAVGPMPVPEALRLFEKIARGLEAAHDRGIVHRDLKPANIHIGADGEPKILDFGLAKALETVQPDLSRSPTLTRDATEAGVLLGTAAYMSPEQAKGHPVDRRTDVWAFGCCLYEALTGKPPFVGQSVSEVLAKILERDPDWEALPASLPRPGQILLRRCLRKDRAERLRDVGDARLELDDAATGVASEMPRLRRSARRSAIALGLASILIATVGGWWVGGHRIPVAAPVTRFSIPLPAMEPLSLLLPGGGIENIQVAISPDGRRIAIVKPSPGAPAQIYLRSLDRVDFEPIGGTEGARAPFFSPDGEWVAFFTSKELKKIPIQGGTPMVLCDLPGGHVLGGTWSPDGTIVFATDLSRGLLRVSEDGGSPQRLTELGAKESLHAWPDVLPDGRTLLLTVLFETSERADDGRIEILTLSTGERHKLLDGGTFARYTPTGHILFARNETVFAAPFGNGSDGAKWRVPVASGVGLNRSFGYASFAVSKNDVLVDVSSAGGVRALVSVDATGKATPLSIEPGRFLDVRLSPDGRRLAFTRTSSLKHDVWIYDLERGTVSQLTTDSDHHNLAWSPDGKYLTFDRDVPPEPRALMWKRVDGMRPTEQLLQTDLSVFPGSWSADGTYVAFASGEPRKSLWVLPMEGERRPACVLDVTETDGVMDVFEPIFSPDARWIAYVDRGRGTVEVIDFPGADHRWTIAKGVRPIWHPDGRGLFYQAEGRMMSVSIRSDPSFAVGEPRLLFEDPGLTLDYDVAPDGKTFYMIRQAELAVPSQVDVVLNWSSELGTLVPGSD